MPSTPNNASSWASLSKRERAIAVRFAEGLTYQQVGEALFIAPATVRAHLAAIYRKLDVHNKAALVKLVVAQGAAEAAAEVLDDAGAQQARPADDAPAGAAVRADRRIAAILAADVVGYSRLMERREQETLDRLKTLRRELVEPRIAEHRGRIIKLMGDGLLAEFASVVDAVQCAVAVQQGIADPERAEPDPDRIVLRIGINLGDVIQEPDGDLYGDGVNVAARLQQLASPGGIAVSGTAHDHLQGKLSCGFAFAGEQQVKNLARPIRVYYVTLDGAAPVEPSALRARRPQRWGLFAAAVLFGAIFLGGVWHFWPVEPARATPSIAVLPFDNLGGDDATGRLADGITEDIITDLARFREVDVIAWNSTVGYKGKAVNAREIGRDLNARYLLVGSVQRADERIRITAQLIDSENGSHVWSSRWDRPSKDVFAVQMELSEAIVAKMSGWGVLAEAERSRARRRPPDSLSAYDLTILATDARHRFSKENAQEAIRLADRAIQADPNYARAYVARAWMHTIFASFTGDYAAEIPKMEADAVKAVELDPNDAEAHAVYGEALGNKGRLVEALAEFEKALLYQASKLLTRL